MARPRKNASKTQRSLLTPDEVHEELVPLEEQPYLLPEGWKWVKLGDVVSVSKEKTEDFSSPSLRYIGLEHLEKDYGIIGFASVEGIRSLKNIFHPGQILYGKLRPYLNKHDIVDFPGVCSTDILVFSCKDGTNNKFINYFFNLNHFKEYAVANSKGINLPRVSEQVVLNAFFPLPPFDDQQRIVDRIESLFAKLDEAREKAEAVLDGFESRKAAVLHKAFTGELTAKWRKEKNISLESWDSCPLIFVLKEKPRNGYSPKPVEYKTNVKSMTLTATTSGFFRSEFFKYIDEEIPENSHLWLSQGDILIQRANSLEKVGTSAIYTGRDHEFIYPDLIMKLQVKEPHSYKYIAYILSTQPTLNYFRAKATGTAGNMPKINQQIVSNTPILLPSCEEQNEIVRILDSLLAKEKRGKESAETVLEQIDLMKKAILARAFRGELTGPVHN